MWEPKGGCQDDGQEATHDERRGGGGGGGGNGACQEVPGGPRGVRCGEPGGCSAGGGRRRAAARRRRRGRPRPWRSRTRTWSSTFSAERTAAAASARAALLEAGVLIRASEAPGGRDHLCGSAQSAALSGPASSPPVAPGLLLLIRALRPLICICLNYTHCITLPSHFSMF
ncbi:unnamed protein product [Prorocentrum cordatum]|uniref:Uncharacterized protein n=2 Tax=Prorocentrum cordatum TaxID=2364126 RepID=A0ABN9R9A6_9DINO|nr:unnamed protein product [Polarella glacialis]